MKYDYQSIISTLEALIEGDVLLDEDEINDIKSALDIVELDSLNPSEI